jgi:hypothetical protein
VKESERVEEQQFLISDKRETFLFLRKDKKISLPFQRV